MWRHDDGRAATGARFGPENAGRKNREGAGQTTHRLVLYARPHFSQDTRLKTQNDFPSPLQLPPPSASGLPPAGRVIWGASGS
jgi:hypothetical protein